MFGNSINETETIDNPYKYVGYYYDKETDNYYLMSRYYNPEIARFISEDIYRGELNDPLSLNRYVYVNNNPMIYRDPNGQAPVPLITGIIGGLYGGGSKIISNVISGNDWYEGVAGATIQGVTTGFGFSLCGTACGGLGGYLGNITGQAVESYLATGKVSTNHNNWNSKYGFRTTGRKSKQLGY